MVTIYNKTNGSTYCAFGFFENFHVGRIEEV